MSGPSPTIEPPAPEPEAPERPARRSPGDSVRAGIRRALDNPRWLGPAAGVVILFVLGYLVVGVQVVPVAGLAGLAAITWRRDPGRPLALTALVLLVVAALGTVLVIAPSPDGWTMNFPADRTLAASAGRMAGLLFGLASVVMAFSERTRASGARHRRDGRTAGRPGLLAGSGEMSLLVGSAAVVIVLLAGAVIVRLALAPPALSIAYESLVTNLRFGTSYAAGLVTPDGTAASTPPLAPVLVAYVPVAAREFAVLCGLVTVVACGRLALRLRGLAAGVLALALAAVVPAMWDAPLAVVLAGLALIAAVILADGARITTSRAAWAGLGLGLAALAQPQTALAAVLVMGWSRDRGTQPRRIALMGAAAVTTLAMWWVWLHDRFGGFFPAKGLGAFATEPVSLSRHAPLLTACVSLVVLGAGMALARRRGLLRSWWVLWAVPLVALGLDLFAPGARDPLSWSMPLAVTLFAAGLAQHVGRRWASPERRRRGALTGPLPFGMATAGARGEPGAEPAVEDGAGSPDGADALAELGAPAFLVEPAEQDGGGSTEG